MAAAVSGSKTVSQDASPGLTGAVLTTLMGTAIANLTVAQFRYTSPTRSAGTVARAIPTGQSAHCYPDQAGAPHCSIQAHAFTAPGEASIDRHLARNFELATPYRVAGIAKLCQDLLAPVPSAGMSPRKW